MAYFANEDERGRAIAYRRGRACTETDEQIIMRSSSRFV
jgi:hypothetical protein